MSSLGKFYETSTSQSRSARQLPYRGEPLAKRESFTKCQSLPSLGATTTTAASGGNRESLLGPRPARRKQSAADAGCRNPGSGIAKQCRRGYSLLLLSLYQNPLPISTDFPPFRTLRPQKSDKGRGECGNFAKNFSFSFLPDIIEVVFEPPAKYRSTNRREFF